MTLTRLVFVFLLSFPAVSLAIHCDHHGCGNGRFPNIFLFSEQDHAVCATPPASQSPGPFPSEAITNISALTAAINEPPLTIEEKRFTIRQINLVFKELNPNMILYKSLYDYNPCEALKKLSKSLTPEQTNFQFHVAMSEIFTRAHDAHTKYIVPAPFETSYALLGCSIERFYVPGGLEGSDDNARYVVSSVIPGWTFDNPDFQVGVEIIAYGGRLIKEAVNNLAELSFGANDQARLLRGVNYLTYRKLKQELIPTEESVEVAFIDADGKTRQITLPWVFVDTSKGNFSVEMPIRTVHKHGREMSEEEENCNPQLMSQTSIKSLLERYSVQSKILSREEIEVSTDFDDLFQAEIIETSVGKIGRLIISSFSSLTTPAFLAESKRIIGLMPEKGLILDLRGNRGGSSLIVKALVEMLTGADLGRQRVAARASDSALQLASRMTIFDEKVRNESLEVYKRAIIAGDFLTGPTNIELFSPYAQALQERIYFGPLMTIINSRTFSSGDVFTMVQKDLELSTLVGTFDNSAGGGATKISYGQLCKQLPLTYPKIKDPLDFDTAHYRYYRMGNTAGAIVEHFGIEADVRYYRTLNDVINDDCDLIEYIASELEKTTTDTSAATTA